jgi:hypothetical protein
VDRYDRLTGHKMLVGLASISALTSTSVGFDTAVITEAWGGRNRCGGVCIR